MANLDAIGVLELGYQNHPDEQAWLQAVAQEVVPNLGGDWLCGVGFIAHGTQVPEPPIAVVTPEGSRLDDDTVVQMVMATHGAMPADQRQQVARIVAAPGVASVVELLGTLPDGLSKDWPVVVRDCHGVFIPLGDGRTVWLSNVCGSSSGIDRGAKRLWQRLAIHLGAGCRLVGRPDSAEAPDVEAVLAAGGGVVHATGACEGRDERELLRTAARTLDRVRTRQGRQDPSAALELWLGLWAGRWSLVDHFDADGKHFLLARRNDPDAPRPKALSGRQRQVAFYASLGWSNSEIGYALGISENTVSSHLHQALGKLRLNSRSELVQLTAHLEAASMD
ncbi:MAG: hypothetical protein KC776_29270 [Myxococcales bacterium]|nr:hypothetical protein [Myxococcales bacterium]MCB9582484.1 hypothetical protein [Polyangiaceae bacterium]